MSDSSCPGCGGHYQIFFGPNHDVGEFYYACPTCRISTDATTAPVGDWDRLKAHMAAIKESRWDYDVTPVPLPGELPPEFMAAKEHINELLKARARFSHLADVRARRGFNRGIDPWVLARWY